MNPGVIVLIAALVVFVGIGVFFLASYLKVKWPAGMKITKTYKGYTVHFIHDAGSVKYFQADPVGVAVLASKAVWALAVEWDKQRNGKGPSSEVIKEVVVHVLDDANYDKTYDIPHKTSSNGMYRSLKVRSKSLPVAAIRGSVYKVTEDTGNVIIHEMIHHIIGEHKSSSGLPIWSDPGHEAVDFWYGTSPEPLEVDAMELYKTIK